MFWIWLNKAILYYILFLNAKRLIVRHCFMARTLTTHENTDGGI